MNGLISGVNRSKLIIKKMEKKNIKTEMNHQMKQKKAIEDKVKVFCKGGNNK